MVGLGASQEFLDVALSNVFTRLFVGGGFLLYIPSAPFFIWFGVGLLNCHWSNLPSVEFMTKFMVNCFSISILVFALLLFSRCL